MGNEEHEVICGRVTAKMKTLIDTIVTRDTHLNTSDWLRVAAREKLERDHPEEFKLLKEGEK